MQKAAVEVGLTMKSLTVSDLESWEDPDCRIRMALGLNVEICCRSFSLSRRAKRGYSEKQLGEHVCRQPSSDKANFVFSSSLAKKAEGTSMSATRMVRRSSG